jgi:hypothetical protein
MNFIAKQTFRENPLRSLISARRTSTRHPLVRQTVFQGGPLGAVPAPEATQNEWHDRGLQKVFHLIE